MKRKTSEERKVLTPAECRVLNLLSTGMRDVEIAERLGVATATVKTHLHGGYRKLGVRNRMEAVRAYEKTQGGTDDGGETHELPA